MSFPEIKEKTSEACTNLNTYTVYTLCRFWLEILEYVLSPHLPPVLKEVLPEDVLSGVLMIQHLSKKCSYLLSRSTEFHRLTYKDRNIRS